MKELVVLSGKGGTGKTSLVGCLAALNDKTVLVDCDVDASNLHLILQPEIQIKHDFIGGKKAHVYPAMCTGCGLCEVSCRFDAMRESDAAGITPGPTFEVDSLKCEGCGVCAVVCPEDAIRLEDHVSGRWFESESEYGPVVHGELGVAEGNSGKLVSQLRNRGVEIARERDLPLVIIDGSPGIGCPVIASLTGMSYALVVTEPSLTALHDMVRLLDLARHFEVPTGVCINKYDINETMTGTIEKKAAELGADIVGRVRFDPAVSEAQRASKPLVRYIQNSTTQEIEAVWERVSQHLQLSDKVSPKVRGER